MKKIGRTRRHKRVSKKIKGTSSQPRLVVFRSKKHIYAQVVDDTAHHTVAGCSTLSKDFSTNAKPNNHDVAKNVGIMIAERTLKLGIKSVSFDRGGYKYHGRVKSLADGARERGLKF